MDCISNLPSGLRDRGSDLVVRIGKLEEVFVNLAKSVGVIAFYVHQEATYEELEVQ